MGITLDQLVYDATDGGAEVASHVKSGDDGTAIGHVSDALKVNFSNTTIDVSATDLDIRDLTHVTDSVKVGDGTDFLAIAADGSIAVTDNGGSLTVDAVDFDIRDLDASQDNVAISDGTDTLAVNTDGSINTKQAAPSNPKTSTETVGLTAVEIFATPLTERTRILVQNKGSKDIYFGESNAVTTANGICIPRGASMELPYGAAANIWAISSAAGQDVRGLELD